MPNVGIQATATVQEGKSKSVVKTEMPIQPRWQSHTCSTFGKSQPIGLPSTFRLPTYIPKFLPKPSTEMMASSNTPEARCINPTLLYPPYIGPHWPQNQPPTPADTPREEPNTEHPAKPLDKRVKKPSQKATKRRTRKAVKQAQEASITDSNWVIDSFRLTRNEKVFLLDLLESATRRPPTEKEHESYEDEFWTNYAGFINRLYLLGE